MRDVPAQPPPGRGARPDPADGGTRLPDGAPEADETGDDIDDDRAPDTRTVADDEADWAQRLWEP